MFCEITLIKKEIVNAELRVLFKIKDTCFNDIIEIIAPRGENGLVCEPIAIIKLYQKRNLNIARNLALYYITLSEGCKFLESDKNLIETAIPSLSYTQYISKSVEIYYREFEYALTKYKKQEEIAKLIDKLKTQLNLN